MLEIYQTLARLALEEFPGVVTKVSFLGGTSANPNKLRLTFIDGSFLDVWLSHEGDYSYHWEHRGQSGKYYRWDNAPHYPNVSSFPEHFHDGEEKMIKESHIGISPEDALRRVFGFISHKLRKL